MTTETLAIQLRKSVSQDIPLPGAGDTAARHRLLFENGRKDLSLARLAEAHWDAVAILRENGNVPKLDCLYGVWASERPGQPLAFEREGYFFRINGKKMFCSGAGLVDRALVTVGGPLPQLVDVDLRGKVEALRFDDSDWKTSAFEETHTSTVTFQELRVCAEDLVGTPGWYLQRPGFWHGACGPAACWAGGAAGLVDYAKEQSREDPHTLAHLGAMHASIWALRSFLDTAAHEIDASPRDCQRALVLALSVRHFVEQASTDVLRRFARAYGPRPLAMDEKIAQRYQELDLYLRQSHAERDLEALGRTIRESSVRGSLKT
jgi:alkylation response protein AidB-like acyl-CoA dehydrogenase